MTDIVANAAIADYVGTWKTLAGLTARFNLLNVLDFCSLAEGVVLYDEIILIGTPSPVPEEKLRPLLQPLIDANCIRVVSQDNNVRVPIDRGVDSRSDSRQDSREIEAWLETQRIVAGERIYRRPALPLIRQAPYYSKAAIVPDDHAVCDLMGHYSSLKDALKVLRESSRAPFVPYLTVPIPPIASQVFRYASTPEELPARVIEVRERYTNLRRQLAELRVILGDETVHPLNKLRHISSWQRSWKTLVEYRHKAAVVQLANSSNDIIDIKEAVDGLGNAVLRRSKLIEKLLDLTEKTYYRWRVRILHQTAGAYLKRADAEMNSLIEMTFRHSPTQEEIAEVIRFANVKYHKSTEAKTPNPDVDKVQLLEERMARAAAEALPRIDVASWPREPDTTAEHALARVPGETDSTVFDRDVLGSDRRKWTRAPHSTQKPEARPSRGVRARREGLPAVDLEIQISLHTVNGEKVLHYVITSPSGVVQLSLREAMTRPLGSLEAFRERVIRHIEKYQQRFHAIDGYLTKEEVAPELQSLGHELYEQLFPPEMRLLYRQWRDKVRTVQITSSEVWIPWELVRPYDHEIQPVIDDDFLSARFHLTRWLPTGTAPSPKIQVQRMACIEGGEGGPSLPAAAKEKRFVEDFARDLGVEIASPRQATFENVLAVIREGEVDLLHFVGHGEYAAVDPQESKIFLIDGTSLWAGRLHGTTLRKVWEKRPMVFFNACSTGKQGWALTGPSGWVNAWVKIGGAGAFIAPQWLVRDSLAHEFARVFYLALARGRTLGRAAHLARSWGRRKNRQDATWLAFAVYGHPNARVTFGPEEGFARRVQTQASLPKQSAPDPIVDPLLNIAPSEGLGPPVAHVIQPVSVRLTVHQARFARSPKMFYFLNLTNRSAESVEITHAWYEEQGCYIKISPWSRPLPVRLENNQAWCTWLAVDEIPAESRQNVYDRFRIRLSTGEIFKSRREDTIPPMGSVPGGPIDSRDV